MRLTVLLAALAVAAAFGTSSTPAGAEGLSKWSCKVEFAGWPSNPDGTATCVSPWADGESTFAASMTQDSKTESNGCDTWNRTGTITLHTDYEFGDYTDSYAMTSHELGTAGEGTIQLGSGGTGVAHLSSNVSGGCVHEDSPGAVTVALALSDPVGAAGLAANIAAGKVDDAVPATTTTPPGTPDDVETAQNMACDVTTLSQLCSTRPDGTNWYTITWTDPRNKTWYLYDVTRPYDYVSARAHFPYTSAYHRSVCATLTFEGGGEYHSWCHQSESQSDDEVFAYSGDTNPGRARLKPWAWYSSPTGVADKLILKARY